MSNVFLKDRPQFTKCIKDIDAKVLSLDDCDKIEDIFWKTFPMNNWGKVDWNKIEKKVYIGADPEKIIPSLQKLLDINNFNKNVYIEWNDASLHTIQTNLDSIVNNFNSLGYVAFEKFIFNTELGYIVEIRTGDDMTIGVIK